MNADGDAPPKKSKKKKKNKDISINQVEDLKDSLQKHLKEINKLFGKKTIQQDNLFSDASEESSDDDGDALNKQIAALKKLINSNAAVLKGEIGPEGAMETENLDILDDEGDDKAKESAEVAAESLNKKRQEHH